MLPTIVREGDVVVMIDQRKLPATEAVCVRCRTAPEVARAIKTMVIRGAPAIGVAAAMGIAIGMRKSAATGTQKLAVEFYKICELMAATRPTAVNLFWSIERMKRTFAAAAGSGASVEQIQDRLDREAEAIHDEDVASCRAMGAFGAEVVPADARILTHCNAGALATAGYGTALGVIRGAVEAGKRVAVFADETRPFLQGARLTSVGASMRDGIDTTVITDNMAGALMSGQGTRQLRRRRRRSHRGERRHGEQDRHVRRGRPGARACDSVLRRSAPFHDRSEYAGWIANSDRGAQREGSDAHQRRQACRLRGPPSGIRRST